MRTSASAYTDRIVKLLISLGFFVGDCCLRLALRVLGRKPGPMCTILYYHSVPDEHRGGFSRQMDIVAALTEPIPVDRTAQLLSGRRYCAVTFDDGFKDIIDNAVPELLKRAIPAAVFVTAAYLGQSAEWWPASAPERLKGIASAEALRQLPPELISIGSHTLTHPYLTTLDETEARHELYGSRRLLQELFERKVEILSFPYGDFNSDLVNWSKDAGYERVFTSLPGNAYPYSFMSGRVSADPTDSTAEFFLKLMGAYRWLPFAIYWKRRILSSPPVGHIARRRGTGRLRSAFLQREITKGDK